MKLFVTGGMGFIGSNFIRYMFNKNSNIEIINFDLLTYACNPSSLNDLESNQRYKLIKGDIRDRSALKKALNNKIDTIVHFAAYTHVDRSIYQPIDFIETDIVGTYNLLDLARKSGVEKIILASTDEVYGSTETISFIENDTLNPSSPYSASKASADLMALAFYKTYNIPITIVRSSNNYGPFQHPEKFIPKMILKAINDKTLPLYGDGKQIRDWIYVLDNCSAIDFIIKNGKNGEIYNIAANNELTNVEVATTLLKTLKKPIQLIKSVPDRPGHDRRYSINISKIKKMGWHKKFEFQDALLKTINWYKENKWWWESFMEDHFVQSSTPWIPNNSSDKIKP